jgi:hypothetical protein
MGSMTKVTVGLPIVERIGTCSRRVSEQLFRTTPTALLKRAERPLATGIAMRSCRFARISQARGWKRKQKVASLEVNSD